MRRCMAVLKDLPRVAVCPGSSINIRWRYIRPSGVMHACHTRAAASRRQMWARNVTLLILPLALWNSGRVHAPRPTGLKTARSAPHQLPTAALSRTLSSFEATSRTNAARTAQVVATVPSTGATCPHGIRAIRGSRNRTLQPPARTGSDALHTTVSEYAALPLAIIHSYPVP